jgi:hypothetical protein
MKCLRLAVLGMLLAGCGSERGTLNAEPPPTLRAQKADLDSAAPDAAPPDTPPKIEGQVMSRVRATVNGKPILEDELRETCWLPLRQIANAPEPQRTNLQKEIINAKLNELIDREVLYTEAEARLGKRDEVWGKLRDYAEKEYDKQVKSMEQRSGAKDEEELKKALETQGMTLFNLKRQITRSFVANEFARSIIFKEIEALGHPEFLRYYEEHPGEFQNEDRVHWQDIFLDDTGFANRDECRKLAEKIAEQAREGTSMADLSEKHNMGESKYRKGEGLGQKRGEVKPSEVEGYLFGMKEGQIMLVEFPTGYHIIRLDHRDFAGPQPLDKQTQLEIKRKLSNIIADREYKRLLKEMRSKATIQILLDD